MYWKRYSKSGAFFLSAGQFNFSLVSLYYFFDNVQAKAVIFLFCCVFVIIGKPIGENFVLNTCLLYTSDAADE